jgi:hypothetical protein
VFTLLIVHTAGARNVTMQSEPALEPANKAGAGSHWIAVQGGQPINLATLSCSSVERRAK